VKRWEVKELNASDGSIINRGKDKQGRTIWEVSVSLGRDPSTGKRLRKTARVHGTKAEARKVRDEMRREIDSGVRYDADKVTLRDFVETYMEARRTAAKAQPETLDTQEQQLRVICDLLGDVKLKDVTPPMVQGLYPKLKKHIEAHNAGKCSTTTLHAYHVSLNSCMKHALMQDLILRNPCERVEAPKVAKPERRAMPLHEAARLLAELDKAEAEAYADMDGKEARRRDPGAARAYVRGLPRLSGIMAARIGLATGMRLGEVLALQWECIDIENGLVSVRRGLSRKERVKDAKSDAGRRTVAIDPGTAAHLARWRETQRELLEGIGAWHGGETPVICSQTGTRLQHSTFYAQWWNPFREAHGFAGWKFHELRHTQATQLLANGVDVKTVQERMGHANAAITLDWYGHALPENDRAAADMLGELYRTGERPRARIVKLKTA